MRRAAERRWQTLALCCIALVALVALIMPGAAPAQQPSRDSRDSMELSIELVDPKVLRVCADPHNLPFSNEKLEGFENKLAELFAKKLDKSLAYTWFPQATGFVRQTLGSHRCDVIMGFPQGDDLVQSTNPYYRTAYAFIFKPGGDLEGIDQLSDERLKSKRIGIVAGTPAATYLAMNGLLARAKPYALMVDTRIDSSAEAMVKDLKSGEIDVGILWGPMAGYYAKQETPALRVVPILKENGGPRLAYRLTMGVRAADQAWKRQLNRLIQENQGEINRLLIGYGVPLLDEKDQPITEDALTKKP
jgi:quinoprotein dehydrogenase-associated probable ABC transporter substrate-binding protein